MNGVCFLWTRLKYCSVFPWSKLETLHCLYEVPLVLQQYELNQNLPRACLVLLCDVTTAL